MEVRLSSKVPPLQKGKLRLYSMRFCPYAQRVHLVLDAKKIPYDVVNVNMSEKPDWLFNKNPNGKVPVLEVDGGDTLHDSFVIAEYLDEKYSYRPLHSRDPWKKAKDKLLIQLFNKVINALYKLFLDPNNLDKQSVDNIIGELIVFEEELDARGKPFFGGERPGMVDYMMWPWCERSDLLRIMGGDRWSLSKQKFQKLYIVTKQTRRISSNPLPMMPCANRLIVFTMIPCANRLIVFTMIPCANRPIVFTMIPKTSNPLGSNGDGKMEWRNAMKEDDAVKESYLEPNLHAKYFKSRLGGYPDYDILCRQAKFMSSVISRQVQGHSADQCDVITKRGVRIFVSSYAGIQAMPEIKPGTLSSVGRQTAD
uniref:GST N-terminal domain-containing protein n=1 Tax=Timema bartmani TaxID=61472 RepID=A0A7R9EPT7_9NEOP|nr:unnamed protein product [Timema bartmani]